MTTSSSGMMDGSVTIHEVEERLGNELEEGEAEYGTLAGFMTSYFGDIPEVGQSFVQDGWAFTVQEADQRRVARVRVERAAQVDLLSGQTAEELNHE